MIAAAHLDNFLFLLFVAIAIFFQILTRAATKTRRRPDDTTRGPMPTPQSPRSIPRAAEETDEDRIRKFLEALGQPTTSKPPQPVAPRTDIPPRPVAPIQPPSSMRPFSFPERRVRPEERRKSVVILQEATQASAASFEKQERIAPAPPPSVVKAADEAYAIATPPVSKTTGTKIDIATLLRSASGLRDAMILREIFGPPRSLQPLDLVGNV
jgi:hypothetical protein